MEKSCGAIILNNNEILLITSLKGENGLPKGHMIDGETEEETAIREVKEETNLDIIIDSKKRYQIGYYVENGNFKEVVFFIAKPKDINNINLICQEEEVSNIFWVPIDKANDYIIFDDIKDMLSKALNI